jgi:hypothetical protein
MFKTSPAALGVAAPHPSGHGAAHALFQRGEFRETDLAEVHSPTITEKWPDRREDRLWQLNPLWRDLNQFIQVCGIMFIHFLRRSYGFYEYF